MKYTVKQTARHRRCVIFKQDNGNDQKTAGKTQLAGNLFYVQFFMQESVTAV